MGKVNFAVRGFGAPSKYIQGKGEFHRLPSYTCRYGSKAIIIIDTIFYDEFKVLLEQMYASAGSEVAVVKFNGEVTEAEIARVTELAIQERSEVVVGIGGGKTLDVAKGVAADGNLALVIMPTTASTDAPCSALSVIYHENGQHSHERWYAKNPDLVLADVEIISKAPVRFLVAGMGDALATYFEARANDWSDSGNYIFMNRDGSGCRRTRLAMTIAESCYEILLEEGLKAKIAAENKLCTKALEDIIEVNILFSGLGFENSGCAGAHAIANGMTELEQSYKSLHGEKVAFGVICQLMIENRPIAEINQVIEFCLQVGLPITLEELSIEPIEKNIEVIAKASTPSNWLSEPFLITTDLIYDGIVQANEYVKYLKVSSN